MEREPNSQIQRESETETIGTEVPRLPDMSRYWNEYPQIPGDSGRYLEEDR